MNLLFKTHLHIPHTYDPVGILEPGPKVPKEPRCRVYSESDQKQTIFSNLAAHIAACFLRTATFDKFYRAFSGISGTIAIRDRHLSLDIGICEDSHSHLLSLAQDVQPQNHRHHSPWPDPSQYHVLHQNVAHNQNRHLIKTHIPLLFISKLILILLPGAWRLMSQ